MQEEVGVRVSSLLFGTTLLNYAAAHNQDAVGKAVVDSIAAQAKTLRTWVFETDEDGYIDLTYDLPIEGSPLFKNDNGEYTLPLGTVIIHERQAPTGYLNNNIDKYWIRTVTPEGNAETVKTYNAPNGDTVIKEQVKRGDLSFTKKFSNTGNRGKNIPFLLTSKSTGEKHLACSST